jgi:hypothetical protein
MTSIRELQRYHIIDPSGDKCPEGDYVLFEDVQRLLFSNVNRKQVLICIEGGCVQDIITHDTTIDFHIADNDEQTTERMHPTLQTRFETQYAIDESRNDPQTQEAARQ